MLHLNISSQIYESSAHIVEQFCLPDNTTYKISYIFIEWSDVIYSDEWKGPQL